MIIIDDKAKCCGCSACANACPKECIELHSDDEGFLYPVVETEKCIHCDICDKVCPMLNYPRKEDSKIRKTIVAQIKDEHLLHECTSGGVVTILADYLCAKGWYICVVNYDDEFNVIHEITRDKNRIRTSAGSKYVQSDMMSNYREMKMLLEDGQAVMFCGTPCQVVGLKNYLRKDYARLLTIDLACHGVPSPFLWKKYVEYIESKRGKLEHVSFRSKRFGYHVTVMEERYQDGRSYYGSARTNMMSKIFFSNIADRMSCYECPFKTVNRISDLTVYDCWHASELIDSLDDNDKGYTNVIVQSEKGQCVLNECKDLLFYKEADSQKAIELDGSMLIKSTIKHGSREEFYHYLKRNGIEKAVKCFLPISYTDLVIERSKVFLYKLGVLNKIKAVRDRICH